MEEFFFYNEENQEVDLVTIDVAVAEIIKNIVRINHGNVAATSVFREEMSTSHIASNTIKDVLKQRSSRGTGSKMYQFDGLEPTTLQERLLDVTERGMKNALNKTFTAAINTLDTDPDLETSRLPDNILFYKKRTPQNEGDFMDSSKFLAPLYDFGEHTFYGYFPTEEYP